MSRASLALCLAANHLRLFAPAASSASSRTWRRKDLNPFVDRARDASSVTRFPACGRAITAAENTLTQSVEGGAEEHVSCRVAPPPGEEHEG